MQTLAEHKANPQNSSRPLFYDEKISLRDENSNGSVSMYLDINKKKSTIESLHFEEEIPSFWTPFFSALCLLAKGQKLTEAKKITWNQFKIFFNSDSNLGCLPFFNKPVLMLGQLIDQYSHGPVSESCHPQEEDNPLVCRCFGVFEGDLKKVISSEGFVDIRKVIDETCAGGGCGHCIPQIKDLLSIEGTDDSPFFSHFCESGKVPRVDGMTPVEIILKGHDLLSKWEDLPSKSFEIEALRGRCLDVRLESGEEPVLWKERAESYLKRNLSREIAVKIISP
jgi:bacterioferritin-associated ferredoxin